MIYTSTSYYAHIFNYDLIDYKNIDQTYLKKILKPLKHHIYYL